MLTSAANPRVKALVRLRKRSSRDDRGVTLVEGYDELALALEGGGKPIELFYAPEVAGSDPLGVTARISAFPGATVTEISRGVLEKVSYRESPDGWLAVMRTPGCALDRLDPGPEPLILVCESIEKPGNLGAMLRTAEAAGVSAVISAEAVTDWGNPNVVRASKGTVFTVPVAADSSAAVLAWLRTRHAAVVVTTPDGTRRPAEVDMTGPTAIVIGSESSGVTPLWHKEADAAVQIPMYGHVNSLNAAAAAAIVLYEANRQRHAVGEPGE
jgi:RNA methyltransferase, TrmH family